MDYEFIRGDTQVIGGFQFVDEEGNILKLDDADEMYFTLKKTYKANDYIIQKKLSKGEIQYQDGCYYLILEHDDTANMKYGTYVYDIQIVSRGFVRTPILGTITLTEEATFKSNE